MKPVFVTPEIIKGIVSDGFFYLNAVYRGMSEAPVGMFVDRLNLDEMLHISYGVWHEKNVLRGRAGVKDFIDEMCILNDVGRQTLAWQSDCSAAFLKSCRPYNTEYTELYRRMERVDEWKAKMFLAELGRKALPVFPVREEMKKILVSTYLAEISRIVNRNVLVLAQDSGYR